MALLTDIFSDSSVSVSFSKIFLTLLVMFLIGAMLGYLLEVLFRRFFTAHKWVNPGFMKGPWLPMYGFGLLIMYLICFLMLRYFPSEWIFYNPYGDLFGRSPASMATVYDLLPIAIMTLGMILLEFLSGLVFVKGFKVRLWDYSNLKGNIMGIICPEFNLLWFAVAVIYYYGVDPFVYEMFNALFGYMFGEGGDTAHFGFIFFIGLVYGIFLIDLIDSLNLFNRIASRAKKSGFITHYEDARNEQRQKSKEARKKFYENLPETLKNAHERDVVRGKKLYEKARSAVMIDPSKVNSNQDNYDENGRPKKEEDSVLNEGEEEKKP